MVNIELTSEIQIWWVGGGWWRPLTMNWLIQLASELSYKLFNDGFFKKKKKRAGRPSRNGCCKRIYQRGRLLSSCLNATRVETGPNNKNTSKINGQLPVNGRQSWLTSENHEDSGRSFYRDPRQLSKTRPYPRTRCSSKTIINSITDSHGSNWSGLTCLRQGLASD